MRQLLTSLIALIIGSLTTWAQLTLEQCRTLARDNYPLINQYGLVKQATDFTLSNARKSWLPQVGLSAQATWQNHSISFPDAFNNIMESAGLDVEGIRKDQYRIQADVTQTIWDGGASKAQQNIAKAEDAEAASSNTVNLYQVEERVDDLFFGILLLDAQIRQTNITLRLLDSNCDKIKALVKGGTATESDQCAIEAERLQVKQRLTQMQSNRDSYAKMLGLFINRDMSTESLVTPSAEEPALQQDNRPELALFDARLNTLASREAAIKASTMPRFALFGQAYYGYPGLNFMDAVFNHDWSFNLLVGVKMSWNIGAFYTKGNDLGKIKNARQQVEVQREVFRFNNSLTATRQRDDIALKRKIVKDDDQIVELKRKVRIAAESKLRNGIIDTDDLLRKISDEDNAAATRDMRKIELLKSIYQLKHTINQ